MAGFSLHGDVRLILIIIIDLLTGGNSVQTINSFSHFDIRPLILFCVRGRTLNSSYSIFKVPGFFRRTHYLTQRPELPGNSSVFGEKCALQPDLFLKHCIGTQK